MTSSHENLLTIAKTAPSLPDRKTARQAPPLALRMTIHDEIWVGTNTQTTSYDFSHTNPIRNPEIDV